MIVVVGRTTLGTQGTEELLVHRCDAIPLPFTRHTACDRVHGLGLSIDHELLRCIMGCTNDLLAHRCDAFPLPFTRHTACDRVHGLGLSIDHEHIRCITGCKEELLAHRCDALPLISTHTAWDGV
jgi:hypothetical protein